MNRHKKSPTSARLVGQLRSLMGGAQVTRCAGISLSASGTIHGRDRGAVCSLGPMADTLG